MKVRNIFLLLLIVLLIASFTFVVFAGVPIGIYDFNPVGTIQQGLDLTGGITIVYEAADPNVEDLDTKIKGAMDIFRNRLDEKGFTEAIITTQGTTKIRVEVPINDSSKEADPAEIISFISTPAVIEFKDPDGNVVLKGENIKSAKPMVDESGEYLVSFELDEQGTKDFADATSKWKGKTISIYLDDAMISNPTVENTITGGKGQITGDFTLEEAENLAMQIESGAIPLELNVIEQRTVSSTLGDDALANSIKAAIIGFIILFIFMIAVYRIPGLLADIALIGYTSLVIFFISWFGVQLTLPGIAGIILGIGMAVDANVVIFERIKEEFREGRSLRSSIKSGFHKASTAIIDSNITTIIAAAVLAIFGTGSIKGFAYTLLISIVVSMFTALVLSQMLLKLVAGIAPNGTRMYFPIKKENKENLSGGEKKKPFDIVGHFKKLVIIPVALIVVAVVVSIIGGGLNLGVDFTGGTVVSVDMGEQFNSEEVLGVVEKVEGTGTGVSVTSSEGNQALVKIQSSGSEATDEQVINNMISALNDAGYENASLYNTDNVGAASSADLVKNAILSVVIACALMLIYITIRFEFWMALGAVVALVHDVLIMICAMGIFRICVDSTFIAACLTIVGYSINNTVIVFDKVRDHLYTNSAADKKEIVADAVRATLGRTINTTITTLIMIVSLYILGVHSIKVFTLPIIVGLLAGTFSSLIVAPSFWALCSAKSKKNKHATRKVKVIK